MPDPDLRAGLVTSLRRAARRVGLTVKMAMPKGLYARSLLIVIAPVVLLQSVIAYAFMERHWQTVTNRLSASVASDIAARLGEACFDWLEEPILRVGGEDIPIPVSPALEKGSIPSASLIHDTAMWLVTRKAPPWAA